MNVQAALVELEYTEIEISKLYAWFAEAFVKDREASVIFYRMHLKEEAHVRRIRFLRRLARQNPRLFLDILLDSSTLEEIRATVRALIGSPWSPTCAEAVRATLDLESKAAESRSRAASGQSHGAIRRLLDGLEVEDLEQAAALCEFGRRRQYLPAWDPSASAPPARPSPKPEARPSAPRLSLAGKQLLQRAG